jgi:hypothetical protein
MKRKAAIASLKSESKTSQRKKLKEAESRIDNPFKISW